MKKKYKVLYKGRLINLIRKEKRFPNGYVGQLEVIIHPGAALVVPFLTNDKLIILRQYRPVIDKYMYELPAGTLKKGEKPLLCARREIVEETGYLAGKLTYLGYIYPVPGYSTEKIIIYKAESLKKTERAAEEDEVIETQVATKAEIKRLFNAGKIIDAKTISALALCGWL